MALVIESHPDPEHMSLIVVLGFVKNYHFFTKMTSFLQVLFGMFLIFGMVFDYNFFWKNRNYDILVVIITKIYDAYNIKIHYKEPFNLNESSV